MTPSRAPLTTGAPRKAARSRTTELPQWFTTIFQSGGLETTELTKVSPNDLSSLVTAKENITYTKLPKRLLSPANTTT